MCGWWPPFLPQNARLGRHCSGAEQVRPEFLGPHVRRLRFKKHDQVLDLKIVKDDESEWQPVKRITRRPPCSASELASSIPSRAAPWSKAGARAVDLG
jgi:hypothetical protein